jgi:hypothetical protein
MTPFPPGSRSLDADEEWHDLSRAYPHLRAFVYGTNRDALVYTYDGKTETLTVRMAIVEGTLVP